MEGQTVTVVSPDVVAITVPVTAFVFAAWAAGSAFITLAGIIVASGL